MAFYENPLMLKRAPLHNPCGAESLTDKPVVTRFSHEIDIPIPRAFFLFPFLCLAV